MKKKEQWYKIISIPYVGDGTSWRDEKDLIISVSDTRKEELKALTE